MKVTSIKRIIFKFRYSKFRIFRKLVSIFVFAILALCFVIVNVLNRFICQTEDCKSETVIETDLKPHIKSTDNQCLSKIDKVKSDLKYFGIGDFSCSILSSKSETECLQSQFQSEEFFSDFNVNQRLGSPSTYFNQIQSNVFKQMTEVEKNTPLAFSILCHANIGLFEALFTSIFRPHNSYCIYVDAKAKSEFKRSIQTMVDIYKDHFPDTTLIIANPTRRIYWSDVSILEAGLDCLQRLLVANTSWKFFLNTVGSALPGMPIQQVAHLLNETSKDIVASIPMPDTVKEYVSKKFKLPMQATSAEFDFHETGVETSFQYHQVFIPFQTMVRKSPPPRGLKLYYNMTESVLTRKTAEFILKNQIAKEFREWVQDIKAPEEFFYATLVRVNQVLASTSFIVEQDEKTDPTNGICPRYSNWNATTCQGKMKRWICNLSLEDLPSALSTKCIWINKFDLKTDSRSIHCMHDYLTK